MTMGRDIDLAVVALEAEGKPALFLPAEFSTPGYSDEIGRQVVVIPVRRLGHELGRAHARFLGELAFGGRFWILALIDAALRHLPPLSAALLVGNVGTSSDPYEIVA